MVKFQDGMVILRASSEVKFYYMEINDAINESFPKGKIYYGIHVV